MIKKILKILQKLSIERPIFHSEADFVLAFGLKLSELPNCSIRLEYPMEIEYEYPDSKVCKPAHIDMIVKTESEVIGIELKYKTKKTKISFRGEKFNLKNHGARDVGRYHFRQDIYRLEQLVKSKKITSGLAIMLTNEVKYVCEGLNDKTLDGQFRLGSSELPKRADWNVSKEFFDKHYNFYEGKWVSKRTNKPSWIYGTEFSKTLNLKSSYKCNWLLYSEVGSEKLNYLAIEIE